VSYNPSEFEIEIIVRHYPDRTYQSVLSEPEPDEVYKLSKNITHIELSRTLNQDKYLVDNCEHDYSEGSCELCGKTDPREADDFEEYDRMDLDQQIKVRKMR
jgi:hypothetical protein